MLETLDYTIRIGSTPTFLYFDLYLYSAYAAHFVYIKFQSLLSLGAAAINLLFTISSFLLMLKIRSWDERTWKSSCHCITFTLQKQSFCKVSIISSRQSGTECLHVKRPGFAAMGRKMSW